MRPGWTPRHFAAQLNAAMDSASLMQSELGAESGVKPPVISRWRSGQAQPSYENLCRVARALGAHGVDAARLAALFDTAGYLAPADPGAAPEAPAWFRRYFPGELWDERYARVWDSGLDEEVAVGMIAHALGQQHADRLASLAPA